LKALDIHAGKTPQTTCAICLDDFDDEGCDGRGVSIVRCGHQFHKGCIHSWLDGGNLTCPTCKHVCGSFAPM